MDEGENKSFTALPHISRSLTWYTEKSLVHAGKSGKGAEVSVVFDSRVQLLKQSVRSITYRVRYAIHSRELFKPGCSKTNTNHRPDQVDVIFST